MKKILLSVSSLVLALTASAQFSSDSTGFTNNYMEGGSNCFANSAPNNGGIMADDGSNFEKGDGKYLQEDGLTLESKDMLSGSSVIWFALPAVDVEANTCVFMNDKSVGVDMSNHSTISITATSSVAGGELEFFLGGEGKFFPSSSTFNDGDGNSAIVTLTFDKANEEQTFVVDYLETPDVTTWENWAGKNNVQSVGYRSATDGADFVVKKVDLGSLVPVGLEEFVSNEASFSVYPNPVTDGVINFSETVEEVELYNIQGNLVKAGSNVNKLSVDGLESGIYVVQSTQGYKRVIIK